MLDRAVPAGFENIQKSRDIAVRIGMGVDQRVSHAGLCGQMHDATKRMPFEYFHEEDGIRDVQTLKTESRIRCQYPKACLFELRIVIGIDIVDPDDAVAAV